MIRSRVLSCVPAAEQFATPEFGPREIAVALGREPPNYSHIYAAAGFQSISLSYVNDAGLLKSTKISVP